MKKFIKSKLVLQIAIASLVATFATAGIVGATTTIGANISTGGTLEVTGATTLTGNVTAAGTLSVTGATTLTATSTHSNGISLTNGEEIINYTDGTVSITDGTNTLFSVIDSGTTGTITFDIASSTGNSQVKAANFLSDTGAIS